MKENSFFNSSMFLPETQEHLVGHESVEQNLRALLEKNKFPHALLITGPQGIGKTTLAYRLARFLLAMSRETKERREDLYLSLTHPVSKRIIQGSHGDFLKISGSSGTETSQEIGVESIRKITHFLHQTAVEGYNRCVLIEDADLMNLNATNALLKCLEEPPEHSFLILISHKEHKLLPTLLSRAHKVRLTPLEKSKERNLLENFLKGESDAEIGFLTDFSKGSPGIALALYALGSKTFYEKALKILDSMLSSPKSSLLPLDLIELMLNKNKKEGVSFDLIVTCFLEILGEILLKKPLVLNHSFEKNMKIWEDVQIIFNESQKYALDPKQTLICAFSILLGD